MIARDATLQGPMRGREGSSELSTSDSASASREVGELEEAGLTAPQSTAGVPLYDPDLLDALGHATRIELLLRLSGDDETVSSLSESMEPEEGVSISYHLVDVLCHQLGFVKEVGSRRIRGVRYTSYGIDWLRVNEAIAWPDDGRESTKRGSAFQGVVDECIGLIERGALEFRQEIVLAWFKAHLGRLNGRPVCVLLEAAQGQLRDAAKPRASRADQHNGIRATVVVVTFGVPASRTSIK